MYRLAFFGLVAGMGMLVAQEPVQEKKEGAPAKEGEKRGKGPFGGRFEGKGPFGRGEKGKGGFVPPSFKSMLEKSDKNKDGALSKDEVDSKMWDRLGKADADKDGKVTDKEFADSRKAMMDKLAGKKKESEEKKKD